MKNIKNKINIIIFLVILLIILFDIAYFAKNKFLSDNELPNLSGSENVDSTGGTVAGLDKDGKPLILGQVHISTGGVMTVGDVEIKDKESFNSVETPSNFELWDTISGFKAVINGAGSEDKDFYNIWRQFLFSDGEDANITYLKKCVNGDETVLNQLPEEYKKICIGENKYDEENQMNYGAIKYQLINYPKILLNSDYDCSAFSESDFDYPVTDELEDENNLLNSTVNNYLVCNLLKDNSYKVEEKLYKFLFAINIGHCEYLEDNALNKLCLEGVKNYGEKLSSSQE